MSLVLAKSARFGKQSNDSNLNSDVDPGSIVKLLKIDILGQNCMGNLGVPIVLACDAPQENAPMIYTLTSVFDLRSKVNRNKK